MWWLRGQPVEPVALVTYVAIFLKRFICLTGRVGEREREREKESLFSDSLLKCSQWPQLGHSKARSPEFLPGVPCGSRGCCILLLSQALQQGAGSEVEQRDLNRYPQKRCRHKCHLLKAALHPIVLCFLHHCVTSPWPCLCVAIHCLYQMPDGCGSSTLHCEPPKL